MKQVKEIFYLRVKHTLDHKSELNYTTTHSSVRKKFYGNLFRFPRTLCKKEMSQKLVSYLIASITPRFKNQPK